MNRFRTINIIFRLDFILLRSKKVKELIDSHLRDATLLLNISTISRFNIELLKDFRFNLILDRFIIVPIEESHAVDLCITLKRPITLILSMEPIAVKESHHNLSKNIIGIDISLLKMINLPHHVGEPACLAATTTIHAVIETSDRGRLVTPHVKSRIITKEPNAISTTCDKTVKASILIRVTHIHSNAILI